MAGFKVIVVGGGLAGALLANGLHNNGVNVTVFERDAEDSKREGYQIRLGQAAINGFEACLTDQHLAAVLHKFGRTSDSTSTAPVVRNSAFKPILDLTRMPSYSKSSAINRVVLRNLLIEPLKTAGRARFGKPFSKYEIIRSEIGEEKVRVIFEDGSSEICDVLVGADGSGSRINTQVGLNNIVKIDSHICFLCKGSLPYERIHQLPAELQRAPTIVFSKGTSLFYALYLPPTESDGAQDNGDFDYNVNEASFYWGLNIPRESLPHNDPSQIPDKHQVCIDYIRNWAPEFQRMLSVGKDDESTAEVHAARLRASKKPSKTWRQDLQKHGSGSGVEGHPRVWLIGDALHAMQPHRGMGGNQALQDCADILPHLLELDTIAKAGVAPSTEQVSIACKSYEDVAIERAFSWVQKSGGTSMPNLNLDGILGKILSFVGSLVIPLVVLFYKVFHVGGTSK